MLIKLILCSCKCLQWAKWPGSTVHLWIESRNSTGGTRKGELLTLFFSAGASVALSWNYELSYMWTVIYIGIQHRLIWIITTQCKQGLQNILLYCLFAPHLRLQIQIPKNKIQLLLIPVQKINFTEIQIQKKYTLARICHNFKIQVQGKIL